jgi:large subunit ribosomal protein L18
MDKLKRKARRKRSVRKKISGTTERPRLSVHRSNKNVYAQIIDDIEGKTICGVSTNSKGEKAAGKESTNKSVKHAEIIGGKIAKAAIEKGVKKVVFDRSGYKYHGVVKAVADSARKAGLEF